MNKEKLLEVFKAIHSVMVENYDLLISLDARYGDGDLGITMSNGFKAVCDSVEATESNDLGMVLRGCSGAFNTAAPSTLGTLFSFWLMGMAKTLKGNEEADLAMVADAMLDGINVMMQRGKSAPGEKTIIDSILPGAEALKANADKGVEEAVKAACAAAVAGLEATRNMVGKHGRIAYYGEKTLGDEDAGATAGMLLFKAMEGYYVR